MFTSTATLTALLILLLCACTTLPAPLSLEQRAEAAYREERWQQAIELYRELAARNPAVLEPWFRIGNAYAARGQWAAAEGAYRLALVRGDDPRVRHNLGLVRLRLALLDLAAARRDLPADDPRLEQAQELRLQLLLGL